MARLHRRPTTAPERCVPCAELHERDYRSMHDALVGSTAEALEARTERVLEVASKHRSVRRYPTYAALYAQSCFTSGHMEIHYLHPMPASVLPYFRARGYDLPNEPEPAHPFVHPEGIPWRFARPRGGWVGVAWSPTAPRIAFCNASHVCISEPTLSRVYLGGLRQSRIHDLGFDERGARLAVGRGDVARALAGEPEDEAPFQCGVEIYDAEHATELGMEIHDEPVEQLPEVWAHGTRSEVGATRCGAGALEARWGGAVAADVLLEVWRGDELVGRLTR